MVSRWKRLGYSGLSVAVTALACDIAICVRSEIIDVAHHNARFALNSPSGIGYFASFLFGIFWWVLLFCIPGWVVALPIVFLARNLSGRRFWAWWAAGTCIGPIVMYGLACLGPYVLLGSNPSYEGRSYGGIPVWNGWCSVATGVAGMATLLYLLLLRWEQQRTTV